MADELQDSIALLDQLETALLRVPKETRIEWAGTVTKLHSQIKLQRRPLLKSQRDAIVETIEAWR